MGISFCFDAIAHSGVSYGKNVKPDYKHGKLEDIPVAEVNELVLFGKVGDTSIKIRSQFNTFICNGSMQSINVKLCDFYWYGISADTIPVNSGVEMTVSGRDCSVLINSFRENQGEELFILQG